MRISVLYKAKWKKNYFLPQLSMKNITEALGSIFFNENEHGVIVMVNKNNR